MTILNMILPNIEWWGGEWQPCTITWSTTVWNFTPSQWSDIQWCYISPDWTKMYIDFWSNKTLYQYALSTPRDVTTATSVRYISVNTPDWIYFDDTWTYMFIGCENDHSIKRYTLSTPRDISTATQDQSLPLGNYYICNVCLSEDWKHIYYGKYSGSQDTLYSYDLSTAYDLTTATNQKNIYIGSFVLAISVKNNWKYMFVAHIDSPITQYELETPYDITSNKTEIWRFTLSSYNDGRALFVSNDCKYWTFAIGSNWQYIRQYQTVQI